MRIIYYVASTRIKFIKAIIINKRTYIVKPDSYENKSDDINVISGEVLYGVNDNPPFGEKILVAIQHISAIFISIITPGYIICGALGYDITVTTTIISMSLFISGLGTIMQAKKKGRIGAGLLLIQGTSFAFPAIMIVTGKIGGLSLIFGTCLIGALVPLLMGPFLPKIKHFFPPLISGIIVVLIGLSLIHVGAENCAGGVAAVGTENFGSVQNLSIAALVIILIILFQNLKYQIFKIGAIIFALIIGFTVSYFLGMVDFSPLSNTSFFQFPLPFRYGLSFSFATVIPVVIICFVTCVEGIGDITATAMVSGEPISGTTHVKRMSRGIFTGGIITVIGSAFNTFPTAIFSQNSGVIQITGVASRHVGFLIGGFLMLVGVFPFIGTIFAIIPPPVLGGAMLIMFGSIAGAGIKILSIEKLDKRALIIIAVSIGAGLSVGNPDILANLPPIIRDTFASEIATGGLLAIIMNIVMPQKKHQMHALHHEPVE